MGLGRCWGRWGGGRRTRTTRTRTLPLGAPLTTGRLTPISFRSSVSGIRIGCCGFLRWLGLRGRGAPRGRRRRRCASYGRQESGGSGGCGAPRGRWGRRRASHGRAGGGGVGGGGGAPRGGGGARAR